MVLKNERTETQHNNKRQIIVNGYVCMRSTNTQGTSIPEALPALDIGLWAEIGDFVDVVGPGLGHDAAEQTVVETTFVPDVSSFSPMSSTIHDMYRSTPPL